MTEKRPGPTPGVPLIEVSIKRELTVYKYTIQYNYIKINFSRQNDFCDLQSQVQLFKDLSTKFKDCW